MKIRIFWLCALIVMLAANSIFAAAKTKEEYARLAASSDGAEATEAIRNLRAMGKSGLDALLTTYAAQIRKFSETGAADEEWKRIAQALDAVAQQKDAYAARLFWYTDLEQAKSAANSQNKPILSLRLLGNLNDEFSCANSRFFRAILYPNAEVTRILSENYILHWKSVRPAPKVTIDFGDGRKIERTITGNSIHYILSEDGEIIDALPGLYSPKMFLKYLIQGKDVSKMIDGAAAAQRERILLRYRRAAFNEIMSKRAKAVQAAKVTLTEPKPEPVASRDGVFLTINPTAINAAPVAATKMVMTDEISILRRIADDFARYEPQIDFSDWTKLARLYSPSPKLDAASVAFIRRQNAKTGLSDAEFASLLAKLEIFVSLDTTRNDFLYHPKLYSWLNRTNESDLENFNSRVYAEIFKTPDSDKWLGLYNTDVYTALDGNGIIK